MKGRQKLGTHRIYNYSPKDVALAFKKVAESRYGEKSIGPTKYWLVMNNPVNYLTIDVSPTETEQCIFGEVRISSDKLSADFYVCPENDSVISCLVSGRFQAEAEKFLEEIESHLKEKSIYKGKAINTEGKFIDTSKINPDDYFYSAKNLDDLETHIWTLIKKTKRCREENLSLRRKVLLLGIYGAGKTFTANLTAKIAVENGWTFIYMEPTAEGNLKAISNIYKMARVYSPAVVFIEDIDHEQRATDAYSLQKNLDEFDGLKSKGDEIITIMTANKTDRIIAAMQRPGRIDKFIQLGELNSKDIEKFIRKTIRKELLDESIDWDKIAEHCKGYPPAFLNGLANSAVLHSINHNDEKIGTELLTKSADELRKQLETCKNAMGFR